MARLISQIGRKTGPAILPPLYPTTYEKLKNIRSESILENGTEIKTYLLVYCDYN